MKTIHAVAAAAALCALSACGGGGGGGGVREVPFTSFPVAANTAVAMTGISETIGGTLDLTGTVVTSIDANSVMDGGSSTAKLTYGGSGNLSAATFSAPQSGVSFGSGTVDCSFPPTCSADSATAALVLINPAAAPPFGSWNYQTYGVWLHQSSPTTFRAGAMSAGAVTPGTAVPTTGNATFSGLATGFFVNSFGQSFATAADMTANVDFVNRSIGFSTANTMANLFNGSGVPTPGPALDLTGTLTYAPGSSQFIGPVTSGNGLSGNANGRFYGPAAQEIGGVYSLTGIDPLMRMLGAFGGRRP